MPKRKTVYTAINAENLLDECSRFPVKLLQ